MIFFLELLVPAGRFTNDQRRALAGRLTLTELIRHADEVADVVDPSEAASADPGVMSMIEDSSHVVVHEIENWFVGGRALEPEDPCRYVARVYVPAPWRKGMSAFLIASITRAIAKFDPDPDHLYDRSHAEVAVLGVPEGSYGVRGRVAKESDVLDLITAARESREPSRPDGRLVDPVCGMLAAEGLTLEHNGTVYGFCSEGCRRHFATGLATSG